MDNIEKIDLNNIDWKSSKEFFDSIKNELEKLEDHKESYDFTWVGKRKSIIEAGKPINKTLRPDVEASKDFDNTKNMLIVGDNLDALKILQEPYLGQVKMIYIDPPYNTGHDFVYRDNFTIKKDEYEDDAIDEDGDKVVAEEQPKENSRSNGRFHSDWLSMICPRLKLARNLLSDDGVIFISIDDNEQANLKKVCDEVFGEENFIANLIWTNKEGGAGSDSKIINVKHEYTLCYARNINCVAVNGVDVEDTERYTYEDQYVKVRGKYQLVKLVTYSLGYVASLDYPIEAPDGSLILPNIHGEKVARWRWGKEKLAWGLRNDFVEFKKDKNDQWQIYTKQYLNCDKDGKIIARTKRPYAVIDQYSTTQAAKQLQKMFDVKLFDYSKPVNLLRFFTDIATSVDSLILDFFAGSGTTGHAVMDLNAEDGGNRRYILVQLPEETNEKSEARKAGYETIDQITAERLRRAGDKIQKEHPDAKIDTGFRVFRIDSSNEKENIRKPLGEYSQESMLDMVENLKPDRTPLDLLFGAIYASALPFDLKLEIKKIGDNTVYLYGYLGEGSGLAACFDDHITEETIQEIAKLKTLSAVFKDSSFDNSAAKINLSEHFRILSVDTIVKVI